MCKERKRLPRVHARHKIGLVSLNYGTPLSLPLNYVTMRGASVRQRDTAS